MASSTKQIPSSVIIVGSGVFGLSTAHALATRDEFKNTSITVLERVDFPAPDGSSIDSSRIIRPDYADGAYSLLMAEAHKYWRSEFGADGRYTEAGLCIVTDEGDGIGEGDASDYMFKAMENVKSRLGLKVGRREEGGQVEPLRSARDVSRVMATMEGNCGTKGYVNWTSGWADAEAGVRHMRKLVEQTGRVSFRTAEVKRLVFGQGKVESVELVSGEQLQADLTILATGAWTPKLVDLQGICSSTGQILAYIDLTQDEQDRLGKNPTLLCENSGMFIIQPRGRQLKVARHGYGYANPTTIDHPEKPGEMITVSLPRTKLDDENLNIPAEGDKACREFLRKSIPYLAERPWTHTKICWYTDTPTGNWLIDYHPSYGNLFMATAGCGHGYKFLPNIGQRIADVMLGQDRDALGKELRVKWRWPQQKHKTDHIWTDDWRGGRKGMILDEELGKLGADVRSSKL
ncbi:FAD dependent oxidoreductase [Hortaea werneckii]|nr:FAD dependent oxidoreductase [Hortaea werneckii]